jgi:hypothetical protein
MSSGRRRRKRAAGAKETTHTTSPATPAATRQLPVLTKYCTYSGVTALPARSPIVLSATARPRFLTNYLGTTTAVAMLSTPMAKTRPRICRV